MPSHLLKDRSTRTPLLWILGNSFVIDTLLHTISPKYDSVDSLLIIWKQTKLSAGDNIYIVHKLYYFPFHIEKPYEKLTCNILQNKTKKEFQ
jgi:hypothetical protein